MRIKISLLLGFLLLINYTGITQSLYELKYHYDTPKGRDDYKALLLRNEDGTGSIRVSFTDRKYNSRNLYDMDMVEAYADGDDGKEDTTTLIYVGSEHPVKVTGKSDYLPDHFVFQLDPKTGFYEPFFVLSIHANDKEVVGELDKVELLHQEDLTKDFLEQYYTENDEEFKNFFDEAKTRGITVEQKQNTKLHLVIVANTEDDFIGPSCVVDEKGTLKLFTQVADFLGITVTKTVIDGANFSRNNVSTALNNLKPNPNDIVVFYYSGHGFNVPNSQKVYPYLDLREKSSQSIFVNNSIDASHILNIENIYDDIVKKGARLNLVISDCCNSDPGNSSNILPDGPSTRTSSIGWNAFNCKSLFMSDQPVSLLITAAAKGEFSAGTITKGGIFTFNFRESLENNLSPLAKEVTWSGLVTEARSQTISTAKHTGCRQPDNKLASCIQNPVFTMRSR